MNRFCAHCDQPVDEVPEGKEWTTRSGDVGKFKHKAPSVKGIPNCGRQFLAEHETYTEA